MYFTSRLDDILFIGYQETLNQDFEVLKQLLEIPDSVGLSRDSAKSHCNPDSLDKFMSEEAKQNIRDWYSRDYEFLELVRDKTRASQLMVTSANKTVDIYMSTLFSCLRLLE